MHPRTCDAPVSWLDVLWGGCLQKRRAELEEQLKMVQSMGGVVSEDMSLAERQAQVQKELDEMEQAALKIQTMNRGKKARGDVAKKREEEDAKRKERRRSINRGRLKCHRRRRDRARHRRTRGNRAHRRGSECLSRSKKCKSKEDALP